LDANRSQTNSLSEGISVHKRGDRDMKKFILTGLVFHFVTGTLLLNLAKTGVARADETSPAPRYARCESEESAYNGYRKEYGLTSDPYTVPAHYLKKEIHAWDTNDDDAIETVIFSNDILDDHSMAERNAIAEFHRKLKEFKRDGTCP
jgi:hypothetical protein